MELDMSGLTSKILGRVVFIEDRIQAMIFVWH